MPKPPWRRTARAQLYNNAAAALQERYADRFICQATFPWDDIEASVKEVERASALGFRAVSICGSWMDQNLDAYELYPFWEAVSGCDMACIVHNFTQGHRGSMTEHITPYPMVGTERYHRLHIGTYVGFGLDYAVACCALTLGGVLEEFPNLRFLFFEAGASWMAHAMHGADRSFYIERACSRSDALPSELIKRHCMTAIESLEPGKAKAVVVEGGETAAMVRARLMYVAKAVGVKLDMAVKEDRVLFALKNGRRRRS